MKLGLLFSLPSLQCLVQHWQQSCLLPSSEGGSPSAPSFQFPYSWSNSSSPALQRAQKWVSQVHGIALTPIWPDTVAMIPTTACKSRTTFPSDSSETTHEHLHLFKILLGKLSSSQSLMHFSPLFHKRKDSLIYSFFQLERWSSLIIHTLCCYCIFHGWISLAFWKTFQPFLNHNNYW